MPVIASGSIVLTHQPEVAIDTTLESADGSQTVDAEFQVKSNAYGLYDKASGKLLQGGIVLPDGSAAGVSNALVEPGSDGATRLSIETELEADRTRLASLDMTGPAYEGAVGPVPLDGNFTPDPTGELKMMYLRAYHWLEMDGAGVYHDRVQAGVATPGYLGLSAGSAKGEGSEDTRYATLTLKGGSGALSSPDAVLPAAELAAALTVSEAFRAASVRGLGLAPLDASAFPPMVTDYMQASETGNAFALESQGSGSFERQNPEANHPGIVGVRTSSTANSGGRSKTGLNTFVLGGGEVYEHIFRVVYASNTTGKYGFHDSYTSAAPANGAWINVSGTTLTGKTRRASAESTTPSSYTITTGIWYHLKIEVNTDATQVSFRLFDSDGENELWSDALSANIPTAGLSACAIATNSGTTARIINDWDWTLFRVNRALTR